MRRLQLDADGDLTQSAIAARARLLGIRVPRGELWLQSALYVPLCSSRTEARSEINATTRSPAGARHAERWSVRRFRVFEDKYNGFGSED